MSKSKKSEEPKDIVEKFSLVDVFTKLTKNLKEIIAVLINIITAVILFSKGDQQKAVHYDNFTLYIEALNFITLLIAIYMLSRKYVLEVNDSEKDGEESELDKLAKLQSKGDSKHRSEKKQIVKDKVKRINTAIQQLIDSHKGFAVALAFLYSLMFVYDVNNMKDKEFNEKSRQTAQKKIDSLTSLTHLREDNFIKNPNYIYNTSLKGIADSLIRKKIIDTTKSSLIVYKEPNQNKIPSSSIAIFNIIKDTSKYNQYYLQKMKSELSDTIKKINLKYPPTNLDDIKFSELKNEISIIDMFKNNNVQNKTVISYLIISVIDVFFNILSGCFLFIAFAVLFTETIDTDNKTSKINYLPAFATGGGIFLFVALSIIVGFYKMPLQVLVVIARILSGVFNGVGMALIFSRFISIEYFFKRSNIITRNYYLIGTIIVLPAYAVVQPLFGLFETNYTGSQDFLKAAVLLLCLWGKIFFFLLLYTMLKNRWLHAYLLTLAFSEQTISDISDDIGGISNLDA